MTMPELPDYEKENDILQFAEEVVNYVLAEFNQNREDWYFQFQALNDADRKMLFRAIADGFNDSTDN